MSYLLLNDNTGVIPTLTSTNAEVSNSSLNDILLSFFENDNTENLIVFNTEKEVVAIAYADQVKACDKNELVLHLYGTEGKVAIVQGNHEKCIKKAALFYERLPFDDLRIFAKSDTSHNQDNIEAAAVNRGASPLVEIFKHS